MSKKYYIETHFASDPFLFRAPISQKLYGMPGWIELPEGTKVEQLIKVVPEYIKKYRQEIPVLIKEFKASKGDMIWQVTKKGDEYICNCTGYQFRRNFQGNSRICKHIKQVLTS